MTCDKIKFSFTFSSQREAEHDLSKSFKKSAHCKIILYNEKGLWENLRWMGFDFRLSFLLLLDPVVKVYIIKVRTAIRVNESLDSSNNGPLGCPYSAVSALCKLFSISALLLWFVAKLVKSKEGKWKCWGKLAVW